MTLFGWEIEFHRERLAVTVCRPKAEPYRVRVFSLYWPFTWSWWERGD